DTLAWVEKSQSVLTALKNEIGDTEEGKKELSNIYLTLASELKTQFESLQDNKQRSAFADGLESFLSGLGSEGSGDRELMLLTASMHSEIGLGLQQHDLTSQASRFFSQGVKVYQELSQQPDSDARRQLAIDRGLANCLRGSEQYEEAIRKFGDILEDPANQRYIDLQVDAAYAFTEWGLSINNPDALAWSIQGGEKRTVDGKETNTILGWSKLAKAAQRARNPELLAEAVFNIARGKFQYGKIKSNTRLQQAAIDEIKKFKTNVPDMGGPHWQQKLEELLARLENEVG
ncbi:MAG: hypothetical protein ACR2NP_15865, partial [Pirellulaceae bacterium]